MFILHGVSPDEWRTLGSPFVFLVALRGSPNGGGVLYWVDLHHSSSGSPKFTGCLRSLGRTLPGFEWHAKAKWYVKYTG